MTRKSLDDLARPTRGGALSRLEEMRRAVGLDHPRYHKGLTRADDLRELGVLRERRYPGHLDKLVEQISLGSAAGRYALSSLAAERVQGSLRSATEALVEMRFGEHTRRG